MLLFLCKLFESQKLGFYKAQGWEKKSGFFRARVRVSMCAPTHIRTHRHTAMPAHSTQWEKIAGRKFSLCYYTDPNNRKRPMFLLNKEECLYIATKFNDEARAKLVLRWEELERKNTPQLPTTYLDALKALVVSEEEKQALAADNAKKQLTIEMKDAHLLIERQP